MKNGAHKTAKLETALALGVFIWLSISSGYSQSIDSTEVRTIIENRCTVCHGCYDAPCQLKLTAYDGLLRGASKIPVYDQNRFRDIQPTRLFIDAQSEEEWRELGFNSVIETQPETSRSLLSDMLALKVDTNIVPGQPLPADFPLDLNRELVCPAPSEMNKFLKEHQRFGMPYGMAVLPDNELSILHDWANLGFPDFGEDASIPDIILNETTEWETFLNSGGEKQALVSHYLYEHLFLGQLMFESDDRERYFRLIRSITPSGSDAVEIKTIHPNDQPTGQGMYYRFIPVVETTLDKTFFLMS